MTSYITITDVETDPEAPLTSELAKKWRDNPIAIAEGDATVPAALFPTVLLGTITTSGSSSSLTSLTLTGYRFLVLWGISVDPTSTATSGSVTVGSLTVLSSRTSSGSFLVWIDLATGTGISVAIGDVSANTNVTNASTSVTVTTTQSFSGSGTVKVFGVK